MRGAAVWPVAGRGRPGRGAGPWLRALAGVWLLASALFLVSRQQARTALAQDYATEPATAPHPAEAAAAAASRQARLHRLGLDEPLFYVGRRAATATRPAGWRWHGRRNQYHRWLRGLGRGQWGTSARSGRPVGELLGAALAVSLPLMGGAALLAVGAALALGQWLAARPPAGRWVRAALAALQSVPGFALALALLLAFANPEVLDWFPVGELPLAAGPDGPAAATGPALAQLVLPTLALVLAALPGLALPYAAALRHELSQPYAVAARAKGLAARQLVARHARPNALLPLLAQLADLLPALVGGAVVVETVFGQPGMGRLLAHAAATHDHPVLVAGVLLVGTARLLALAATDAALHLTDPRRRWPA